MKATYYLRLIFVGSEVSIKSHKDTEPKDKTVKEPNFLFSIMSDGEKNGNSNKFIPVQIKIRQI